MYQSLDAATYSCFLVLSRDNVLVEGELPTRLQCKWQSFHFTLYWTQMYLEAVHVSLALVPFHEYIVHGIDAYCIAETLSPGIHLANCIMILCTTSAR